MCISLHTYNEDVCAEFLICITYCLSYGLLIKEYRKITGSNTSHLEAHEGFFRLLYMKGIFGPYVL